MFECASHTAYLYDRGGTRQIAMLDPLVKVKWGRTRDDMSQAVVSVASPSASCRRGLGMAEAGRVELVIFRGNTRVWEGPVTHLQYEGARVTITARDVVHYINRTIMRGEYDNRNPNISTVLARMERIFNAELARKEALSPPINVLPHIQYITAVAPAKDAKTAAHTLPYELTVFNHLDAYAARGGLDYTVVGRRLVLFDVHQKIGQTPPCGEDDFIGDLIITQYGNELATYVAMTDGKGHWGDAGGTDPYYGEWEVLHQAYDENAQGSNPEDIPTVAELKSQALRAYAQGKQPPLVVRVPDNTRLNPNGVLTIDDLVPGVWIPLSAELPGRSLSQMQKLDSMSVEESEGNGEVISVTMSPAPEEQVFVDEE